VVTASNGRVPTEQVEGTVEAVNTKGLRIAGAWVNVSQFRPVELPELHPGAHVRVDVDSRGYIKALEVLDASSAHGKPTHATERDDRITRLAVLKAAANFVALDGPVARRSPIRPRPPAGPRHILALAACLRARGHHVTAFGDAGLRHAMAPLVVESLAHDPDYDLAPRETEVARETEGLPHEAQGEHRRDMLAG
jgi:hypothetical protein